MTGVAEPPVTRLTIERDGTVSSASVIHGAPSVAHPRVGFKYWVDAVTNPWVDRACLRFERLNHGLRRAPIVNGRHTVLRQNGLWCVTGMRLQRSASGGWLAYARDVAIGSVALQQALAVSVPDVVLGLGDDALACIVDASGLAWWWPWAMARASGWPPLSVLGHRPPICHPDGQQVEPPPRDDRYVGEAVVIGRRRVRASLTTSPLADGRADLWMIEHRPMLFGPATIRAALAVTLQALALV